jgi:hypothetical protein
MCESGNRSIRFLHIPKTAGTTFGSVLRRQYAGAAEFVFTGDIAADIQRFAELPEAERSAIKFFSGHAPISTGLRDADDAKIITFLREPISRVKSFCQHVWEGKSPYLVHEFPPYRFDLERFLRSGNLEIANLQARMLVRHDKPGWATLGAMSRSEAKHQAIETLFNKIALFGIQEYFDESLLLFTAALNWKRPFYLPLNRKSPDRPLLFKKQHIEQIEELNAIDTEIYKAARKQFLNRISGKDFHQLNVVLFKVLNGMRLRFVG